MLALSLQLSWFPFILYDTDWMGREIYHGDPKGTTAQIAAYDEGVRVGSFGLLLNSVRIVPFISRSRRLRHKLIADQELHHPACRSF